MKVMNKSMSIIKCELNNICYRTGKTVIFTSSSEMIKKTLVEENGRIVDFPGIEEWTKKYVHCDLEGNSLDPFVKYGVSFSSYNSTIFTMYWTVQPDGRYWADEDGFGMTNDLEIVLFTHIDDRGCFTGPFRLYRAGSRYYYYGNNGIASTPIFAYERKYTIPNKNEISITRGLDNYEEVIIPESIKGECVTEVQIAAFLDCEYVRTIVLPDTIKRIGSQAFEGCKSLEHIVLPSYMPIRSLSSDMFRNCASLTSVAMPEGVQGIGREVFSGCKGLEEIVLPKGIRDYGPSFIRGCEKLKRITMPAGIELITPFSFEDSPLSDCMDDIYKCVNTGEAFSFDITSDIVDSNSSTESPASLGEIPYEKEYHILNNLILNNERHTLRCQTSNCVNGVYVFQNDAATNRLIIIGLPVDKRDLTDEQSVHIMMNRLKDIGFVYIPWHSEVKQIGNITYGTCEAIICRDIRYDAAVVAYKGSALLIIGDVKYAMGHLVPVNKQERMVSSLKELARRYIGTLLSKVKG